MDTEKDLDTQMYDAIRKAAGLGQVPDSVPSPGDVLLPKAIANKINKELEEMNWVRRLFPSIVVPKSSRNITIPAVVHDATNVRRISYGDDATSGSEQTFSTKAVVLTPQLFVAYTDMIENDIETAGMDLVRLVRETLTSRLAMAEEQCELYGVSAGGTAYTAAFDGVYTVAAGADCATSAIEYGSSDKRTLKIMEAKNALGVYGVNVNQLVLLCSSSFGLKLRQEDLVYSQQYRVDSDILKTGTMPPISGIKVIETTHLDDKGDVAVLVRKDAFIIGKRKEIHFRSDNIVETFTKRLIIAQELDFKPQLVTVSGGLEKYEGIVLVKSS